MTESRFILGVDGHVHTGEVTRRMSGTIMLTDCATPAMRALGQRETWWAEYPERICPKCMRETDQFDAVESEAG